MNVDALSLRELRIEIAERMGYRWVRGLSGPIMVGPDTKLCFPGPMGVMIEATKCPRPKTYNESGLHGVVPNWPEDIAAAIQLEADLPDFVLSRSGNHWQCTGRLCWSGRAGFSHVMAHDGVPACSCVIATGKTPAEAISRAWLKATVAE